MVTPVSSTPNPAMAGTMESPVPARRPQEEPASVVVNLSAAGARAAASQDSAKVATGIVQASADVNQDGTVSDQEQQTENAQLALKRAMLEGSPDLEQALQAYQTIASLADAQR
ncbi:hypothetical protein [Roseateles puraquae]|jgi:hypothetical protein|uniref:hypothetical protein n=1 Tax=Roseateles puraquae TaxID=431059 RepID=UPI0031E362C3